MLGETTEFGPIDLLGGVLVNMGATKLALSQNDMRFGIKMGQEKEVQAYTDVRFLGGVAAALAGQFGPPMIARAAHDTASGLLNSFVATEMVRAKAKDLCQPPLGRYAAPPPVQLSAPAAPAAEGMGNDYAFAGDDDFGW